MTTPRPGHADLTGAVKYGYRDLRLALERASARETAARVAVGAICKALLGQFGVPGRQLRHGHRRRRGRPGAAGRAELRTALRPGRGQRPALPRPAGRGGHAPTGLGHHAGQGHGGRHLRGDRAGPAAGAGQPRPLGPAAERPAAGRGRVDSRHQGRRDRAGLRERGEMGDGGA